MTRKAYTGQTTHCGPLFDLDDRFRLARRHDPAPSKMAAAEIVRSGAHRRQMDDVYAALVEYIDLYGVSPTTRELANNDEGVVRVYGKRLSDLADHGRVYVDGMRKCRFGNRMAGTWRPKR